MANRNWANAGRLFAMKVAPVWLDCNFIVDPANGNGLGIRSLKGAGISNVFMNSTASFTGTSHTSTLIDGIASGTGSLLVGMPVQGSGIPADTTIASIVDSGSITLSAATSSSTTGSITYQGVGSPNPAAGLILVQFGSSYSGYYGGFAGFNSPLSGTPINVTTGTTKGLAYTIASVGTTTTAQWQKLGLPIGVTPTVGGTFIATDTTTATGTGVIEVPLATGSGITEIDVLGDPTQGLAPDPTSALPGVRAQLVMRCLAATNSSTTTFAATAPATNTVIGAHFFFSNSSVKIGGE